MMKVKILMLFFVFAALCGNAFACGENGGNASVPVFGASVFAPAYFADAEDRPVVCKYCGRTASSAKMLSAMGTCPQSPSKRHVALRGPSPTKRRGYICRWCGYKAATVRLLTSLPCSANPNGKKHVPAS